MAHGCGNVHVTCVQPLPAACILSSARSAGSRSPAGEATAGPCAQSDSEEAPTTAAAARRKSVRVLRTHAGLQLRGGASMHSDARALPIRRVTRSGCGIHALVSVPTRRVTLQVSARPDVVVADR